MPTGPIIFADPTVRAQLLDRGVVTTFRSNKRTTGETHARWERTGKGQVDVTVEHVAEVSPSDPADLAPYRDESGFGTVREWQAAIEVLGGGLPTSGHIYRATLDGLRLDEQGDFADTGGAGE